MNEPTPTQFQQTAEREIASILQRSGRAIDQREAMSGTNPFESLKPQTVVRLRSSSLNIWLFGDEANVSSDGRERRFERADFDSTDQLLTALVDHVSALVAGESSNPQRGR